MAGCFDFFERFEICEILFTSRGLFALDQVRKGKERRVFSGNFPDSVTGVNLAENKAGNFDEDIDPEW